MGCASSAPFMRALHPLQNRHQNGGAPTAGNGSDASPGYDLQPPAGQQAQGIGQGIKERVGAVVDDVEEKIGTTVNSVTGQVTAVAHQVEEGVDSVVHSISDKVQGVGDSVGEMLHGAGGKASDAADAAEEHTKEMQDLIDQLDDVTDKTAKETVAGATKVETVVTAAVDDADATADELLRTVEVTDAEEKKEK